MFHDEIPMQGREISEQDFIAASCAVIFAGASVPTGDFRTHFKNISPGYCEFSALAELRVQGEENYAPVEQTSKASKYPYNGEIRWNLQSQQDFQGNLDLPARLMQESPGRTIDLLDGAWLRISIVEYQRSITGMQHVYHHPPKHFHFSTESFCWIPEPADLG